MIISVCIATYNGEKFIKQQLESILKQLSVNDEVVISDDGSSDNTIAIIKGFADSRIKIVSHKRANVKFIIDYTAHNFENALLHAKGDIIFLSDQDDVWIDGRIKIMLDKLKDSELVVGNCKIVDENLKLIKPSYYNNVRHFKTGIFTNIIRSSYLGNTMGFKRCVYEKALPFPHYGVGHDIWLGIIAKMYYHISFTKSHVTLYRRHNETVSFAAQKRNTNSFFFKLRYRILIIKNILLKCYQHK